MAKMTYQELLSLYTQIHGQVKQARTVSSNVKKNFTTLAETSAITGKAANAAKAYIKEVHGGILNSFDTILENFDQKFSIYVKNYSAVDGDQSLELQDDTLTSVKDVMKSKKGNYEVFLDELTAIMGSVNYICSTSGSTSISQASTQTDTIFSNAQQVVDNLQTKWHSYESRHASAPDDALNLLSQTTSLLSQYSGGKVPSMENYTTGSFRQLAGEEYFKGLEGLAAYNKSHKSMAEEASKYIEEKALQSELNKLVESADSDLTSAEKKRISRLMKTDPEAGMKELLKIMEKKKSSEEFDEFVKSAKEILSDYARNAFNAAHDELTDFALEKGKHVGKAIGARLQPRDAKGRFVRDNNVLRKAVSGKFKGISTKTGANVGKALKWGGRALVVADFVFTAKEYYDETKNVGRSISYSAVVVGLSTAATVGVAAAGAPFLAVAAVGVGVTMIVKAAYKHFKPVRQVIDGIGDGINKAGKAISDFFKPAKSKKTTRSAYA